MCTVSWLHRDDGYHLLCNRDEKRTRGLALAPAQQRIDGVEVLAPRDADAGGTWIAVNEFGIAVTLLNGANLSGEAPDNTPGSAKSVESRGRLLLKLAAASSLREVCERVSRMPLDSYSPFT